MTHQGKVEAASIADPMLPRLFRVQEIKQELSDTFTLALEPVDGGEVQFKPGQINMLYAFGIGEIPISISSDPAQPKTLFHTIRAVGKVSNALVAAKPGTIVGVRGPYGTPWPIESAYGADVLFMAGGVGIAPLRPAIHQVLNEREKFGNVVILYGARTPEDLLFSEELREWRSRFDLSVRVTVDRATSGWNGRVGVVTQLVKGGGYDRLHTVAFVCGPEIMMRYGVDTLRENGITNDRIFISMERNMKCAVGLCGHCQFGSNFVCRDGPVFRFDKVRDIFFMREV